MGENIIDDQALLETQQQITMSLQTAIDDPQGPFAGLEIQEDSLQVNLRKFLIVFHNDPCKDCCYYTMYDIYTSHLISMIYGSFLVTLSSCLYTQMRKRSILNHLVPK